MKKKQKLLIMLFMCLMAAFFLKAPQTVLAANPQTVNLKTNKTYKSYDITGDKKKDTIRVDILKHSGYDYYDSLSVKINGKTAYSFKNKYFYANNGYTEVSVKLYTLKNKKPFLYLYAQADNGDGPVCGVFQYKGGKLKQIINFQTLFKSYGGHNLGEVVSIKGNTITTRFYVMSYVLGPCYVQYKYTYKNGTLKRTSAITNFEKIYSYGKPTTTFYANKALTAYTSAKSSNKAFTIKRGEAVKVDKCYMSGGKMRVRIEYKGKYGWIKAVKGYPGETNKQFSNVTYAG